jgi:hypothetical protein
MVLVESELELREAMLKFRDPGIGDSEGVGVERDENVVREGAMVLVSARETGACPCEGA